MVLEKIKPNFDLTTGTRFGIAIGLGAVAFSSNFILKPAKRGFSCGDMSIRLDNLERETISLYSFYIIAVTITLMVFPFGELFLDQFSTDKRHGPWNDMQRICQLARFISIWLLGIAIDKFFVQLFKLSVGALRPYFVKICFPTDSSIKDIVQQCQNDTTKFLYFYTCQRLPNNDPAIIDAQRSFYSALASTAFFFATFLICYIHRRIWPFFARRFTDLFVLLYVFMIGAVALTAITRLHDHRNHMVDIVCGALAGTFVALFVVFIHKEHFVTDAVPFSCTGASSSADAVAPVN